MHSSIRKFGILVFAGALAGGALFGAGSAAGQGAVSATRSTVVALPATQFADNTSLAIIEVTLKDDAGNPVAGKAVRLSQSANSLIQPAATVNQNSVAIILPPVEATTNAMGIAAFSVKNGAVEIVTYAALDTTDNIAIAQTAMVTFTAKPIQALSVELMVVPNGSYVAGLNAAAVYGGGSAAEVAAQAEASSGRSVMAIWALAGGMWWYYIPAFPELSGGVSRFPCSFACTGDPPVAAYFMLA